MPVITANDGTVTQINIFTCAPDKQDALVASLTETVKAASSVPGWISASVHKSFDGRQVVNYVQFESQDVAQRVTRHLLAGGFIQKNTTLGSVTPGQYEVVHVEERA